MKEIRLCDDGELNLTSELCVKNNLGLEIQGFYNPYIENKQELIKEYDYVYLFDIDEKFIDQYNKLFINGDIKDNQLYKVVKSDSYAILEFVE